MDAIQFFVILAIFYGIITFFHLFFKSCALYPYDTFLQSTGLKIQFLQIKWYTTALNRTIFRWASTFKKFLTQSFNIGVFTTLIILPISIILIIVNLFNTNQQQQTTPSFSKAISNNAKIEIMLPGVNLPLDEVGFYSLSLLICTTVHEFGHALAAVLEDVPVSGFGLNIYFCIPIAYTEINSEHISNAKIMRKLRIFCGGIWHNIILGLFCYLLFFGLEGLLNPIYKINESVIITEVNKNSSLRGERGLQAGDIIHKINHCIVYNDDSWFECLLQSIRHKPNFCVSSDFIHYNDESDQISHGADGVIQCCDPTNLKMSCFEHVSDALNKDNPIEIPQYICLNIRKTIEDSHGFCSSNSCEDSRFCIKPLLNNVTTILTFKRNDKPDVIYIGHPIDVIRTIKISKFVPKIDLFKPQIADTILLFLKYNIVFSIGLAIINAVPCFGLDGHHIMSTIINNILVTKIPERGKRDLITLLVSSLGTLLFFSAILKIAWTSIFSKLL